MSVFGPLGYNALAESKGSLMTSFGDAASGLSNFGFGFKNHGPDAHQGIVLTDIMPNTKFVLPEIPGATKLTSYQGITGAQVDPAPLKNAVAGVESHYMKADMEAKTAVADAMMLASRDMGLDRKVGEAAVRDVFPTGGATGVGAVATVVDPTGIAGGVWAMINSISKELKGPPDPVVNEILEKALTKLHQQSNQANMDFKSGEKPMPPKLDFTAIQSGQQLKEFIKRDVKQDPVMQNIADAKEGLKVLDHNFAMAEGYVEHGNDVDGAEILKFSAGDNKILVAAVGQVEAEEVIAEVEGREPVTAARVKTNDIGFVGGRLKMDNDALAALNSGAAAESPTIGFTLEFDPRKQGLDRDQFRPSGGVAA